MLFCTHLLFGITFFLLLKDYFFGGNILVLFFLVLLGAILPDIDESNSKISKEAGFLGTIVSFLFKHRGIFHSLVLAVLVSFLLGWFWQWPYGIALFVGYLSHLLADGLTPMGVQIFYPLSKFKLRGPVKTGGWGEWLILVLLIVVIVKELV